MMRAVLQNIVGVPQTCFYRWGAGMEVIFDRPTACSGAVHYVMARETEYWNVA